jgi:hypothetical protein
MDVQDVRPRFYEGQYLGADDLSTIVEYTRTEQARHALGGHTWGIAIGLQLTEKSAPGGDKRVEVTLQPGFAWDGYARPIASGRPTRLNESLFAAIPYHPVLDDFATGGTGRLVEVWLAYAETASGNPLPGFESCATDDQHARIGETFRFEIGQQSVSRQRSPVRIGTNSVDASMALKTFDANAAVLFDTSVPHQRFPFDEKPPRWLVPIGFVRWIARDQALGYFAERNLDPADKVDGRIRAFRRYVGSVAERIEAAAGAIVLHRRGNDPLAPHQFATLLNSTLDPAALLRDLVWVEGNLRVVGDAKLSGGDLLFRNADGLDEGTPFYLARRGDNPAVPAAAARELRVAIGPVADPNNRFIVGPEVPPAAPATTPTVAPHLVVVSTGDVGIGRRDPETRLNVVGKRIRLQDVPATPTKRIDLRTEGNGVGLESSTNSITVSASGPSPASNQVLINPGTADGQIGLRVPSPQHDIDAKGHSIKLGLEQDGGGQIVLTHTGPDHVFIEARNAAGAAPAPELRIVGPAATSLPQVTVQAVKSQFTGDVGIGTVAPTARLTIDGKVPAQGVLNVFSASSDIEFDGGTDGIFVFRHLSNGVTSFMQTKVGIGTTAPSDTLHVAGPTMLVDGPGGEGAVVGSEGHGAVAFGSRNGAVSYADMRRLGVPFSTSDANAWLTVYCRTVVEVSDERAKTNIKPIGNALDRVSKLRGVSYTFKGERGTAGGDRLGLIAQEVQKVVPEAVSPDERGAGIAYSTMVPLLIEAVKELKDQLDELRAEVKKLSPAPRTRRSTKAAKAGA